MINIDESLNSSCMRFPGSEIATMELESIQTPPMLSRERAKAHLQQQRGTVTGRFSPRLSNSIMSPLVSREEKSYWEFEILGGKPLILAISRVGLRCRWHFELSHLFPSIWRSILQDSRSHQVLADPYERACRAYFARAKSAHVDQPSESMSGEETIEGKSYFVLRNSRGPLDIFEIRTDGRLSHKPDFDLDSLETSG